jgi:hypothetical protein
MNIKENWSVLKYTGNDTDYDDFNRFTHGCYYYWTCSTRPLIFHCVIDDDGIEAPYDTYSPGSSFWESMRPVWEIAEDPTGIASKLLKK